VSVRLTPVRERTSSFLGGDAEVALDLAEVARVAATGLPESGTLWCYADRVVVRDQPAQGSVPLSLSAELTLPRVWAAPAQALGLSDAEMLGWEELRARLAELQGVERTAPDHVMRLLGYPEDRTGDMPALCGEGAWRLLLQLPAGGGRRRFVWVPGACDLGRAITFVR
jgi:hypothetical protein